MSDDRVFTAGKKNNIMSLFKSKMFVGFAILFLILILSVIFGLLYTSTEFHSSLKPGGGLLDGLIANGISVVISVILISPLTAYFISIRRERQLEPVRRSFVESIASEVDRLATSYIHQAAIYGHAVLTLEGNLFADALGSSLNSFNEWLSQVNAKISKTGDSTVSSKDDNTEAHDILKRVLEEASLVRDMTFSLYQTFYRETVSLENTILFAMPIFSVENVKTLHDIRSMLIGYRGSLQDMLAVLSGDDDAAVGVRAKNAVLDFGELVHKIEALALSSGISSEINNKMQSASAMDKRVGINFQRDIARKLVEIFEQARKYDQDSATIRRGVRAASPHA